jgi:XRE family transcriptional regulator, regulator of sulfur utilization
MTATNRNPDLAKAFGEVVRELRLKGNTAQEALALAAEMDRSYMGRVERGEKQPSLDLVFRIAVALEISPERLVQLVRVRLSAP